MSDKITNTQDRPEEKPLTEQELQFCNLYVNGGLEYAGQPKKCFVEDVYKRQVLSRWMTTRRMPATSSTMTSAGTGCDKPTTVWIFFGRR